MAGKEAKRWGTKQNTTTKHILVIIFPTLSDLQALSCCSHLTNGTQAELGEEFPKENNQTEAELRRQPPPHPRVWFCLPGFWLLKAGDPRD